MKPKFVDDRNGSTLIAALRGHLACLDKRFAKGGKTVGVEYSKLDADEQGDMIAEVDAAMAHLDGLGECRLTHIVVRFDEGLELPTASQGRTGSLQHVGQLPMMATDGAGRTPPVVGGPNGAR
jgi:hypothetical protein